ncbi:hypothetical protein L204_102593 [Cryptococcus depauperatus]
MEQQVLLCLDATLSQDHNIRTNAEQRLKQLFLSLYSASVLLHHYVENHWTPASLSFEHPITPIEVKSEIRSLVFDGLSDPERKIRSASALTQATIARYDWPDDCPDLLSKLINLLTVGSPDSVHGAIRVITDFVNNDLSEDQLATVVSELLPAVLSILVNPQAHSPSTRASTISVFRQVVRMLETVREEHPQAVKNALGPLSEVWFVAFKQILVQDAEAEVSQNWKSIKIRIEIFRTFLLFLSGFPKVIIPQLQDLISLSLSTLQSLLPVFTAFYLSTSDDAPKTPYQDDDTGDLEGNVGLAELACGIFDFLTPAIRKKEVEDSLFQGKKGTEVLEKLIVLVQSYTQVTRENAEEWMEDPNAFVIDEDENTQEYSVRTCGYDLIGSAMDKWAKPVMSILQSLTLQKVQESASLRQSGDCDWWKTLESILAILGGVGDDIRNALDEDKERGRPASFDVSYLFDQVVPGLLGQSDVPFLQGRAFVFASEFSSYLGEELASQYLSAAVAVLEAGNVSVPVKISAVKTIKNFCRHVNSSILQPFTVKILSLVLALLPQAERETLYLLLETVRAVTSVDDSILNRSNTDKLVERMWEVWLRCNYDPVVTAIIEENIESLTLFPDPGVLTAIIHTLCPKLAAAISTPVTDETVHIPGEAIQLANSLIRMRNGPLECQLVTTITRAVMEILKTTDDMDVIQYGMIHLTLFVRKDCDKLIQWHDAHENNGIAIIFDLLGRFLAPTFSESGGIFVGELIMHLLRKAGNTMGSILPDLLRAVVGRLATAQTTSFIQTLILPFAYLFSTEHTLPTIDLLCQFSVPVSEGTYEKRALDVVLEAWCDTCDTITGSWNIRISDMGMSKLFELSDPRLKEVLVKGDMIIDEKNRNTIMTRSKTKLHPNQYSLIPFPLKALKLMLKDVQTEPNCGKKTTSDLNIQYDDGDEEWDDDDPLGDGDEFQLLSSWLDNNGGRENDAQDDDEDLKSDPLAQVDLAQHLVDVLRRGYTSSINGMHEMIESLTSEEKGILRGVLTL